MLTSSWHIQALQFIVLLRRVEVKMYSFMWLKMGIGQRQLLLPLLFSMMPMLAATKSDACVATSEQYVNDDSSVAFTGVVTRILPNKKDADESVANVEITKISKGKVDKIISIRGWRKFPRKMCPPNGVEDIADLHIGREYRFYVHCVGEKQPYDLRWNMSVYD